MKKLVLAAIAGLLCCSQAAMAKVITFEFSATVGNIAVDGSTVPSYPGWEGLDRFVSAGEQITGRFSFDDALAPWTSGPATQPFAVNLPGTLSFTFADSGLSFESTAAGLYAVSADDGMHSMLIGANGPGNNSLYSASLFLGKKEEPGTPYAGDPTAFTDRGFVLNWGVESSVVTMTANVGSVTEVPAINPVPEPASYALMLLGLGLVGAAARRRAA